MQDFRTLPTGPLTLSNVVVPACLYGQTGDLVRTDLSIENGRVGAGGGKVIDMQGAMVLPAFVDMHTHLDKGHIWPRAGNPDGTFMGALTAVGEDRAANWSAEDVRRRADFALRCGYAHGTRAIRTHLDSLPPQDDISWPVFREIREDWAGRIDLQMANLVACDRVEDGGAFRHTADLVAEFGGVLGMVTYPVPDVAERIRTFFRMAAERGLAADFHVDETMDASSETLRAIAEAVLETGFSAPVVVGHCCSLSTQDEARALDTLDLVAKAGINVVSLPMCNLYLQDRHDGRTPRNRGITLVHEMVARGINVSFASDNTRDPFYAYGDLDMLEVLRQATRIGHLDHSRSDWPLAFTANPARACGFDAPSLAPGAPADLVVFNARSWTELLARPQSDRIVLRRGKAIDRTLPAYSELDDLMESA
ncbi:cytosine deaminase [Aliiruegeria haliotis]|uniref:Cytosine deaminase n=1 Tax=Aliiruegeria haliotis TaxID=1280846 RepID=A0A2T0RYY2_9RHOB|nr:cytosine deaminase [Aliiruegeria haliotis]PRY26360.1 cytosine deaminase [Aliiruegeria haliotis]